MLEDNRKIWPTFIEEVKEGFLGLNGRAFIQEKKGRGKIPGKVRVRIYKKPDACRTLTYDWNTE